MHLKICNREKMFSSRFSPSTRTFADAVRNSRSPSPAGDGAAPVDAAVASPDVPRVAIFEANTKDIKSDVEFKGRTYAIEGVVTKYGNYLIAANTWGALASGKDKTTKDAKTIGSKLFNHLAGRVDTLKHNENQLNAHLEVILPLFYPISTLFYPVSTLFYPVSTLFYPVSTLFSYISTSLCTTYFVFCRI